MRSASLTATRLSKAIEKLIYLRAEDAARTVPSERIHASKFRPLADACLVRQASPFPSQSIFAITTTIRALHAVIADA